MGGTGGWPVVACHVPWINISDILHILGIDNYVNDFSNVV